MKHSLSENISTHPWINLFENPNTYDSSHPIIAHEILFKTKAEAKEFGKASSYADYITTVKIVLKK